MPPIHAVPFPARCLAAGLAAAVVLASCGSGAGRVAIEPDIVGVATTTTTAVLTVAPTTTLPPPICKVAAEPGDSLTAIAERNGITVEQLAAENLIDPTAVFHPGKEFDVCVGDFVDPADPTLAAPPLEMVQIQQTKLNEFFADTSLLPLFVDGDSGGWTRQAICVARMGLGLPVHNRHLVPGSEEEAAIFAATELGMPVGAPTDEDKWVLVDQTCQVLITGERDRIVDVFPTSTGAAEHLTFNIRARAFRFDPALDNEGWHDSSSFPVEVDNPLNGNMYKPIYFNDGQAIHGAEYIPPNPRSKGCARTFPKHQDMIIEWLGLQDVTEATWSVKDIDLTVVVQGRYTPLPEDAAA